MIIIENFINGKFVSHDHHIDSYNPSTGDVWAKVPDSGPKEIELAVEAAESALNGYVRLRCHFLKSYLVLY